MSRSFKGHLIEPLIVVVLPVRMVQLLFDDNKIKMARKPWKI